MNKPRRITPFPSRLAPSAGRLSRIVAFTDWLAKAMACVAVMIGAIWSYKLYYDNGDGAPHAALSLKPQALKAGTQRLLVLHVDVHNVGKVVIDNVKKFDICINPVATDPHKAYDLVEPRQRVDTDKETCAYRIDILRKYTGGYDIDPGVDYEEVEALSLAPGLYQAEVELYYDDNQQGGAINARQIVAIE